MPLFKSTCRQSILGSHASSALLAVVLAALVASLFASSQAAGGADMIAPTSPTNLRLVRSTETSVTVAWNAATDNVAVEGYRVHVGLGRVKTRATEHTESGLACGATYVVEVRAYDHARNSSAPARAVVATAPCLDVQPPTTPQGLLQIARSPSTATLAWQPSQDEIAVVGYALSLGGIQLETTSETSYVFIGLRCGATYSVAVRAYDVARNESAWAPYYVTTSACGDVGAPTAPAGLVQLDRTATSMSIAWLASTDNVGVANYVVFRDGTRVAETSGLTYGLAGLTCGTASTIGVEAVDGAGNRSPRTSAVMSTSTCNQSPGGGDVQPPTVPANVTVGSVAQSAVTLSWSPSADDGGVAGYDVFRDGVREHVVSVTSYRFAGLSCGKSYQLGVAAYDAAGNRSNTASVAASTNPCSDSSPPSTPGNVVLLSRTSTSVTVSWAASTDDTRVAGYGAYRDAALVGSTTETTYTFTGLACGTSRTFGVDAYDAAGSRSSRVSVVLQTAACGDTQPPSAPTQLAASSTTPTGFTVGWSASSDNVGVAGYDVFANGSKTATVTGTSAALGTLTCGTSYTVGVEAFDASGNRSSRATASATTSACTSPPPPPTSGTIYVAPNGSDSTLCTQASPCASFERAYRLANPGATVQVAAGSYPPQIMTFDPAKEGAAPRVVFNLDGQTSISGESVLWGAQHLELRGGQWTRVTMRPSDPRGLVPGAKLATDVVVAGATLKSFLIRNGQQITIRDSEVGGFDVSSNLGVPKVGSYPGEEGVANQPSRDIVIEDVSFRDITRMPGVLPHAECLFIEGGVERITVHRSSFTNCAVFDIFVEPRGVLVSDIALENNMFDTPRDSSGAAVGSAISLKGGPFRNVAISWNSIHGNVRTDSADPDWGSSGTLIFRGNAWRNSNCGTWPSQSFVANVGLVACGSSDLQGDPGFVSARSDPCNLASCYRNDLHLVPAALAVNRGPNSAPANDFDGQIRPQGGAPDAGADERS